MLVYKNLIMFGLFSISVFGQFHQSKDLLVCYADIKPYQINNFKTIILEPSFYELHDVIQLKKSNQKVYAYLSVTEVNHQNFEVIDLLKPYIIENHPNWNSVYINISENEVKSYLEEAVKAIFMKGFDGVFLDTLDNAVQLPKYSWMKPHVVQFIKDIHQKYPHKDVIQNGGLELLPQTHQYIKGVLIESVYTNYDFAAKKYQYRNIEQAYLKMKNFRKLLSKYKLKGFLIEYAENSTMKNELSRYIKKISYSITDIDLQTIE